MFADMPRLDAIFVPGGDPGDNPATLVLPYLGTSPRACSAPPAREGLAVAAAFRRAARSTGSTSGSTATSRTGSADSSAGPSSPPLAETRARLDPRYPLRDYPDITHTVRSQYPVPGWDPAFNFTLGREPINPRPVFYAALHDRIAPHTDGFISYSDGVNDDVNKAIWRRKAWDPGRRRPRHPGGVRAPVLRRRVAERAADGLLALERNWEGPLASNGGVDGTLALWQRLEAEAPELEANWRWQMPCSARTTTPTRATGCISRRALEAEAQRALGAAPALGAAARHGPRRGNPRRRATPRLLPEPCGSASTTCARALRVDRHADEHAEHRRAGPSAVPCSISSTIR